MPVLAVQTRSHKALQNKAQADDNLYSHCSCGCDLGEYSGWRGELYGRGSRRVHFGLASFDDSLFEGTACKHRVKLSRSQRKAQAEARKKKSSYPKSLAELTPHNFHDAQAEDVSLRALWAAAERGEGGYFTRGQTLYCQSNELEQLVIPVGY